MWQTCPVRDGLFQPAPKHDLCASSLFRPTSSRERYCTPCAKNGFQRFFPSDDLNLCSDGSISISSKDDRRSSPLEWRPESTEQSRGNHGDVSGGCRLTHGSGLSRGDSICARTSGTEVRLSNLPSLGCSDARVRLSNLLDLRLSSFGWCSVGARRFGHGQPSVSLSNLVDLEVLSQCKTVYTETLSQCKTV